MESKHWRGLISRFATLKLTLGWVGASVAPKLGSGEAIHQAGVSSIDTKALFTLPELCRNSTDMSDQWCM